MGKGKKSDDVLGLFAEQLGTFLGGARAKADEWIEKAKVNPELNRIRSSAEDLLAQVNKASEAAQKQAKGANVNVKKPAAAAKKATKKVVKAVKKAVKR